MILLIDNYDSFSYNLYQLIAEFNDNIKIIKNDELTPEEINLLNPSLIVISPGPGKPEDAGNCIEIIKFFKGKIPIFGVCLGYQAIAKVYGGNITYAKNIMHGKTSDITFDSNSIIFRGLETPIKVARYHSLALEKNTISNEVDIIAYANDGELMAFEDKKNKIYAVQFHPESILTPDGKKIISNIINNNNMIKEAIKKLSNKENLSYLMAESAMNEIMNGQASEVQKSAYLTALSLKGETIEEITASAKVMRNHCVKLLNENEVLEIVGTGGDGSNSFNISTTSSIVIAAAGVSVAKHGNKASSSKCGAADCLNELGVKINISPEKSKAILKKIDICFLFAQNYHLAMKYVAPVRKELGIKTIFNILGPLTNPAGATMQLMGVYDESLVLPMAKVLKNLGVKRALVVYGMDKLDEISLSSETKICELKDNKLSNYTICPEDFGFSRCHKNDLAGGDPKENANITKSIFKGKKGPKRDAVILNSGAALYIANKAKSIEEGCKIAENIIDSGKALKKLEEFIELTNA